jgi:hypothetical protein
MSIFRFADLKGRGCKVPQEVLLKLLEGLQVKFVRSRFSYMYLGIKILVSSSKCQTLLL